MNHNQLRQVDLNLLVVLDVLLRKRSVSAAAGELNLTPSAVSHALGRLRKLFDDELLVRDGRRMRPTHRAEGLVESLPRLLEQTARTISAPASFEPATSTRTFCLAAPDFIAPLLPPLLSELALSAPTVRLELVAFNPAAARQLAENQFDALVAPSALDHGGLRADALGSWPWAVYGRANHPAFADWSLSAWTTYPHLQIRTNVLRGQGPIDRGIVALGLRRRIGAVIPHFSMAAPILAQTDLLLTVPSVTMSASCDVCDLERRTPPLDLPSMGLSLFRSATSGEEPGTRWFLDRVLDAAKHLTDAQ